MGSPLQLDNQTQTFNLNGALASGEIPSIPGTLPRWTRITKYKYGPAAP
jgi:hypothetical protein